MLKNRHVEDYTESIRLLVNCSQPSHSCKRTEATLPSIFLQAYNNQGISHRVEFIEGGVLFNAAMNYFHRMDRPYDKA